MQQRFEWDVTVSVEVQVVAQYLPSSLQEGLHMFGHSCSVLQGFVPVPLPQETSVPSQPQDQPTKKHKGLKHTIAPISSLPLNKATTPSLMNTRI